MSWKRLLISVVAIALFVSVPAFASDRIALCRDCFHFVVHNDTRYDAQIIVQRTSATSIAYAKPGDAANFSPEMRHTYSLKALFKKPGSSGFTIANTVGTAETSSYLTKGSSARLSQSGSEAGHDLHFSWR